MTLLLDVKAVSVYFGGVHALEDVSFHVLEGEFLSLIGPNGAGKTTMLRAITGTVSPQCEYIRLGDQAIHGLPTHRRAQLGLALTHQIVRPFRSMTLLDNVALAVGHRRIQNIARAMVSLNRCAERQKAKHLLALVDIEAAAEEPITGQPLGVLKRLEVARALALEPRLLLLDEPLAGLNHVEAGRLADTITRINSDGLTVVMIEHNLGEVLRSEGDLDGAVRCYRRALELAPGDLQASNNLGLALHAAGRLAEARDVFARLVQVAPRAPEAHNNLGAARYLDGDIAGARRDILQALSLQANYPNALLNLCDIEAAVGNIDDDSELEVLATYDNHHIQAFDPDGVAIDTSDYFTNRSSPWVGNRLTWGQFIRWADPAVEEHVCEQLGLVPEPISTQVIPRDRHAAFFATLGVIASSIENVAIEIRHMQRTEVLEGAEFFSMGQKGSSAMPHKKNPVLTENLTGLARLVRMTVIPAMENVALWHERDISHSSVERGIGPDATVTLDFALNRLAGVVDKMLIFPENMLDNMNKFPGLVMSQRVLLALTQAGVSREDAYSMVQRNALKVWEERLDFRELLLADDVLIAVPARRADPVEMRPGHETRAALARFDVVRRPEQLDVERRIVGVGDRIDVQGVDGEDHRRQALQTGDNRDGEQSGAGHLGNADKETGIPAACVLIAPTAHEMQDVEVMMRN